MNLLDRSVDFQSKAGVYIRYDLIFNLAYISSSGKILVFHSEVGFNFEVLLSYVE